MTTIPDWANPQLLQRSRLKPRATAVPFADTETARTGERERSPFFQLLNGQWRFAYAPDLAHVPAGFEQEAFNHADWATLPVPGCWQLHGYGVPNYTNINYPFPVDPPYVPTENPVALYRTHVLHPGGLGRRSRLPGL